MIALHWLAVFTVTVTADYVWAEWAAAIARKRAHAAAMWGAGTVVCAGLMAIFVTKDPWLILPGALGAYVGTFISVRRGSA